MRGDLGARVAVEEGHHLHADRVPGCGHGGKKRITPGNRRHLAQRLRHQSRRQRTHGPFDFVHEWRPVQNTGDRGFTEEGQAFQTLMRHIPLLHGRSPLRQRRSECPDGRRAGLNSARAGP